MRIEETEIVGEILLIGLRKSVCESRGRSATKADPGKAEGTEELMILGSFLMVLGSVD